MNHKLLLQITATKQVIMDYMEPNGGNTHYSTALWRVSGFYNEWVESKHSNIRIDVKGSQKLKIDITIIL